ncbi:MAG TPA: hypothetical protein VEL70_04385 [Candidatus Acidoferrum sp.]|nr:hypothetical protein [Candidatus Acidoferrum sp.]
MSVNNVNSLGLACFNYRGRLKLIGDICMKLDRLMNLDKLPKLDRVHLAMIGGIAVVVGIMLYIVVSQQGAAIRCGFC